MTPINISCPQQLTCIISSIENCHNLTSLLLHLQFVLHLNYLTQP